MQILNKELNIYSFDLKGFMSEENREKFTDHCIQGHHKEFNRNPRYKKIDQNYRLDVLLTRTLYNKFIMCCMQIFKRMDFSYRNNRICWAQVSNLQHTSFVWHNHLKTSNVAGVYYLKVPDQNSGQIYFGDNQHNILYKHQPFEDNLIVFPSGLNHTPTPCNSNEYRVAISMETILNNNVWEELNG